MKLSRRQLKNLITEAIASMDAPIKLRVLDFDDTIASTGEEVKLHTPDGHRMLSSDEYATYKPLPGEYYDESSFVQFDSVNIEKAKPVNTVFNILMNFVNAEEGNRRILILTARKQVVENDVRAFLESSGIDHSGIDFVGVGSSDPLEKVRKIDEYLDIYNVGFVSFFDDSIKNVIAVKDFLDAKGIPNDVAHIREENEKTRLIRKFY